jgi:hypothetical protein
METKIVYQLSHDLSGHEQRIPLWVYAIIRDATRSHSQAPNARKIRITPALALSAIDSIEAVTVNIPSFINIALKKTTQTVVQNIEISVVEDCSLSH